MKDVHRVSWKRPGTSDLGSVLAPDLPYASISRGGKNGRELVLRFVLARVNSAGLGATSVLDRVARSEVNGK
jgi:hypothetical protein